MDVNADGEIWVGTEQTEETPDLMGKFNFSMELCTEASCDPDRGGGSWSSPMALVFMNALYDPEGYRVGAYTDGEIPQLAPPDNDNRKWVLDLVAEALVAEEGSLEPSPTATVIFEESRHTQQPAVLVEMYNMVYYLLVYFTSESLAMVAALHRAVRRIRSRSPQEGGSRELASRVQHHLLRIRGCRSVLLLRRTSEDPAGVPIEGSEFKWPHT